MKPAILMIHGMWSGPWVWDQWRGQYEQAGYNVITPALRHHEKNADPEQLATTSLRDYVDDLSAVTQGLEEPPILIGHSMGGLLALQLAARVDCHALVLLNSAAPAPLFPLRLKTLPGATRPFLIPGFWKRPLRLYDWEANWLIFNAMPEQQRPALCQQLVAESGQAASEIILGRFDRSGAARLNAKQLQCPVLSLCGEQDRIVPIPVGRRLRDYLLAENPDLQLEHREFADHAHWLLGEPGWQAIADQTLEWLQADIHA